LFLHLEWLCVQLFTNLSQLFFKFIDKQLFLFDCPFKFLLLGFDSRSHALSHKHLSPQICDLVVLYLNSLNVHVNQLWHSFTLLALFKVVDNNFDNIRDFIVHVFLYRLSYIVLKLSSFFTKTWISRLFLCNKDLSSVHELTELVLYVSCELLTFGSTHLKHLLLFI